MSGPRFDATINLPSVISLAALAATLLIWGARLETQFTGLETQMVDLKRQVSTLEAEGKGMDSPAVRLARIEVQLEALREDVRRGNGDR